MRKGRINPKAAIDERVAVQKDISSKFGIEAILEAKNRLCTNCGWSNCLLFPITIKGEDCPYFKQAEVKK